ncbi:hypothetical protein Pcinc_007561 [Petrolisthes cinctipes]|uniref:Uncharacterized protein n=1 Tax=Petrolisthes cinctipes TaxID=88211 RepID=A0AAE1G8E4_PETCI|nr:hypothetical protein Pcinc_007561 [Petrolisthes cinctipes]
MERRSVFVTVFLLLTATDLLQHREVQASECIVYENGFKIKVNVGSFHLRLAPMDSVDPEVIVKQRGIEHEVNLGDITKNRWTYGQLCLTGKPKFFTDESINSCSTATDTTISEVEIQDARVCFGDNEGPRDLALFELHGQGRVNEVYIPRTEGRQWKGKEEGKVEILGVHNTDSTHIKLSVGGNILQMCMAKDMKTTNMPEEDEEVVEEEEEEEEMVEEKDGVEEEIVKGVGVKEEEDVVVEGMEEVVMVEEMEEVVVVEEMEEVVVVEEEMVEEKEEKGLVEGMEEDVVVEEEMTKLMILNKVDPINTPCDPIPANQFIKLNITYKENSITIIANDTYIKKLDNEDTETKGILFYKPEEEASLTIVQYFDTDSLDHYQTNGTDHHFHCEDIQPPMVNLTCPYPIPLNDISSTMGTTLGLDM